MRRAWLTGSPVTIPYRLAGMDLAVIMPCLVLGSPPMAEGRSRRSTLSMPFAMRSDAVQERKAELTST